MNRQAFLKYRRMRVIRSVLAIAALCLLFDSAAMATTKKPPLKPVNINTATAEELQQVPGIGPVTAEKILQMRKSYGLFKSVDDLLAIKGLGRKRVERMRKYLTVGKSAASKSAQPANAARAPNKSATTEPEDPPRR